MRRVAASCGSLDGPYAAPHFYIGADASGHTPGWARDRTPFRARTYGTKGGELRRTPCAFANPRGYLLFRALRGPSQEAPTEVTQHAVYRALDDKARKYELDEPLIVCIGSDQSPAMWLRGPGVVSLEEAIGTAFSQYRSLAAVLAVAIKLTSEILVGFKSRHEALLAFLLGTGCRPSEAFALAWRDLDLERATVTIRRRVERVRTELRILEGTKTNGGRRTLRLATALTNSLRTHRGRQAQSILEAGATYDRAADLVFANDLGGVLDPRNVVNRYFKPALALAGLSPEIRLYDLRHSHATLLLHEGVNVKAVSARLGHASAAMTLDRYAHALPASEAQAIPALDAVLGG